MRAPNSWMSVALSVALTVTRSRAVPSGTVGGRMARTS